MSEQKFYEILFRGDESGMLRGAHIILWDGPGKIGVPRPVGVETDFEFPVVIGMVNAASLQKVAELQADLDGLTKVFTDRLQAALKDAAAKVAAAQAATEKLKADNAALQQQLAQAADNQATMLKEVEAAKAELASSRDFAESMVAKGAELIAGVGTPEEKLAGAAQLLGEMRKPKEQRDLEALQAERDKLDRMIQEKTAQSA